MADSLRRGAVHVIVVALVVAALAPQAVASSAPDPGTEALLASVEAQTVTAGAPRGGLSERAVAALTTLSSRPSADVERFHADGVARPPSADMTPSLIGSPIQWVAQPGGAATISGTASWYCCTRGWGDAAVVALPLALGGHYYAPPGGFTVVVCADRCARLPVGDACGCSWGRVGQKVVDLSPAAWAAITDKDRYIYGVVTVTLYLD